MLGINKVIISHAILRQISEIDEFKGLWRGLDRHTTGLQLLGEVADYGAQLHQVLGPLEAQPITYDVLAKINRMVVRQSAEVPVLRVTEAPLVITKDGKKVGQIAVAERGMARGLTEKLVAWVNEEIAKKELHPLLVAAVFMAVFLQAKPFEEGNMGTVIFIVMLIMLKAGYTYAPYVFLNSLVEAKGDAIFDALKDNQESLEEGAPRWEKWLRAFLLILQDQKDLLYRRLYSRETEIRHLPKLSARVMALFKHHQRLQMKDIIKLTNGRRATVKIRLNELVEGGYLRRYGSGRGTWYAIS